MKLTKEQKKDKSKELAETIKGVSHLYFTHYQGLKFQDMDSLRAELKGIDCRYAVIKNTMLKNALEQAGIEVKGREEILQGPTALLLVAGDDPVSPARVLKKFGKEKEALKVRAGYVDGEWIDEAQCKQMSDLGTKPEMLGKLASALYTSVAQVAWVVNAPIGELARTLHAYEQKLKAEGAE
jgi:large subunit ribosomal protein L10